MTVCTPLKLQDVALSPPSDLRDWDFSFDRKKGLFRWRTDGNEWLCNRAAGQAEVMQASSANGHIIFRCKLLMRDNTAYTYLGDEPVLDVLDFPKTSCLVGEEGQDYGSIPTAPSHWRLCYHRAGRNWRLRDERTSNLWFVNDYRGSINLNWFTGAVNLGSEFDAHIYHDGRVTVDESGTAYFFLE